MKQECLINCSFLLGGRCSKYDKLLVLNDQDRHEALEECEAVKMMIGPLRKVFRKTADGEERVSGLIDIKAGDTFRMESPDNCFDPNCPTQWMEAKTAGYIQDGVQGIVIGRLIEVEGDAPCKTS